MEQIKEEPTEYDDIDAKAYVEAVIQEDIKEEIYSSPDINVEFLKVESHVSLT